MKINISGTTDKDETWLTRETDKIKLSSFRNKIISIKVEVRQEIKEHSKVLMHGRFRLGSSLQWDVNDGERVLTPDGFEPVGMEMNHYSYMIIRPAAGFCCSLRLCGFYDCRLCLTQQSCRFCRQQVSVGPSSPHKHESFQLPWTQPTS